MPGSDTYTSHSLPHNHEGESGPGKWPSACLSLVLRKRRRKKKTQVKLRATSSKVRQNRGKDARYSNMTGSGQLVADGLSGRRCQDRYQCTSDIDTRNALYVSMTVDEICAGWKWRRLWKRFGNVLDMGMKRARVLNTNSGGGAEEGLGWADAQENWTVGWGFVQLQRGSYHDASQRASGGEGSRRSCCPSITP